jgi:hypothetical protein
LRHRLHLPALMVIKIRLFYQVVEFAAIYVGKLYLFFKFFTQILIADFPIGYFKPVDVVLPFNIGLLNHLILFRLEPNLVREKLYGATSSEL